MTPTSSRRVRSAACLTITATVCPSGSAKAYIIRFFFQRILEAAKAVDITPTLPD